MKTNIHDLMGCSIQKLSINQGKGLWFTFANGYTLSIQIGENNYADGHKNISPYGKSRFSTVAAEYACESTDCEIAVLSPDGYLIPLPETLNGDTVAGYIHTSEIPTWIEYVSNL